MEEDPKKNDDANIKAMLDYGLQGKSELSTITVAISIGLFVILSILFQKPTPLTFVALSIGYFALVVLGVWTFANHQMFASITSKYLKEINPKLHKDMEGAVKSNDLAYWMFKKFFITKKNGEKEYISYESQNKRTYLILGSYLSLSIGLWIAISTEVISSYF